MSQAAEQQNLVQDRALAITDGGGKDVSRTYRDADGIHVVYRDGTTADYTIGGVLIVPGP